jgi:hypothetical protein
LTNDEEDQESTWRGAARDSDHDPARPRRVRRDLRVRPRLSDRVAVLAETTDANVTKTVQDYMKSGQLPEENVAAATISVERAVPFGSNTASKITVAYPFDFTVLNPVMRLLNSSSTAGQGTTTMSSTALMRNES